jgi:NAD(P)H dehydrogenase (quinone)
MASVLVLFYSMHGHIHQLAEQIGEGVREVEGCTATLMQVPELMPAEAIAAARATETRAAFASVPMARPEQVADFDAIIVGTPTRFGNMAAQMRNFWDQTADLWMRGALVGKIGSAFVATGTQHGGHETTITSMWHTFCHHGMVITGLPYTERRILNMEEVTGGGPYGAGTMSAADMSRQPSENELQIARSQGRHVATLAKKMFG